MKRIALAFFLATLASCATTPAVTTDFAPGTQFSSFRTYSWLSKPEGISPLVQQRIVDGIDAQLRARGWRQVENGEVAVAANVATAQHQTLETFYSGSMWNDWGWHGNWHGPGPRRGPGSSMHMTRSTTRVRTFEVGTLVVDMFDTSTKQAIWRGTASGTVPNSPARVDAAVQSGLERMFAGFPPGA